MSQTLDFYIDVTNGNIVAAGSGTNGILPPFTRSDSYTFRARLQERDAEGFLRDISTQGVSVKVGVGEIDDGPSDGQFKLAVNSITSDAINYNATAVSIYNAISNNVSTVTTYGNEAFSFILTASQPNTAMSFGGDSFTLFPTSSVLISTRRFPASDINAQQVIKLRRNPAVYADTFTPSPTLGVVSLTKTQDGATTANETYLLSVGKDAEGGGIVLNYGSNSTTAIPVGASPVSFAEALSSVTGIGANNISVDAGNNTGEYSISFVRGLGNTNITTALTLDASGVVFAKFLQSTLTFATSELDELFAEAGTDTITPTLEIEVTSNGTPKTVYQNDITVRRDLITTGSVVPADQASYYTKAEADALFIQDSTANVDATNRILADSSSVDSVGWEARKLYNTSGSEVLRYDQGLGFFGVTATAQPTGPNVVSNLIQLGLNPNSTVTQGVLPLSVRTITTTASLNFGTVGSNSTVAITTSVTGVSLNDIVLLGLPNAICQGLTFIGAIDSANIVQVDAVNATNSSVVQSQQTFRITVIGY